MIRSLLQGVFALALFVAPACAEDCKLTRITTVDMGTDSFGGPYVPVAIGGQTVNLLVDTAGAYSMLTEATVKSLGLHREQLPLYLQFQMFGGNRIDHFVQARDLAIGGITGAKFAFLVMPDGAMATELGGTVAPDILRRYDVEFDFGAGKFSLFSQDHCLGRVVYWSKDYAVIPFTISDDGHIRLTITLDGQEIPVDLDTGTSRSTFSLESAERLFGIPEPRPPIPRAVCTCEAILSRA